MTSSRAGSRSGPAAGLHGDGLVKPRLRLVHDFGREKPSGSETQPARSRRRNTSSFAAESELRRAGKSPSRSAPTAGAPPRGRGAGALPRRRSRVVIVVSIAALVLVIFSVVAGQVILAQAGYSKASAERELERARAEYVRARLEEAQARLPRNVEQRARDEMGLADAPDEEPLALGPSEPPPSATPTVTAAEQPR